MRPVARLALVATLPIVVVVAGATSAFAHAGFVSSDPAPGQVLETAPPSVSITFSEPPDPELSFVKVLDAGGGVVAQGGNVTDGEPLERTGERTISLPLDDLSDGVYTVSWQAVSTADGHITTNAFAFGVGASVGTVPEPSGTIPTSPTPTATSIAGKVALYVGLSLLVALGVVGAGLFGGRLRAAPTIALAGAVCALGGTIAMVIAEHAAVSGSGGAALTTSELLRSDAGAPYLRLLVAVAVAALCAVVAAARTRRWTLALVGAVGAAAMFVRASGGHASGSSIVQETLQFAHFVAIGVWIGGLALLWLLLREQHGDPPAREATSFSTVATVAVGVVVLTGSFRAVNEMGGIGALAHVFSTTYGTVLVAKVAVAIVLIALGAANRFRSVPRVGRGDGSTMLTRVVTAEIVTALGVFALTGALTGLPPATDEDVAPAPAATPSGITVTGADFATTVRASLAASPGSPGPNNFELTLTDYDAASAFPADRVSLRFTPLGHPDVPATMLDLMSHGDVWHGSGASLSLAGTWNVTAQVQAGAETTEVPMTLTTIIPGATTSVSSTAGQPTITTVAMPNGTSAQVYVDPGTQGTNQVHLTAFDGTETLPLADATFVAIQTGTESGEEPIVLDAVRFEPGHFVANTELSAGDWTFDLTARARDGGFLQATVHQSIGGT
jgi:copper transport protein